MSLCNVQPTAKVIWRWGHSLVSSDRLQQAGIELGSPGYKASGLSFIMKAPILYLEKMHNLSPKRDTYFLISQ